jgi:hypothetical protein
LLKSCLDVLPQVNKNEQTGLRQAGAQLANSSSLDYSALLRGFVLLDCLVLQVNKNEQNRLRQAGAQLAPLGFHLQGPAKPQEMGVGPLRMWPGGLCVSRCVGDYKSVTCVVHAAESPCSMLSLSCAAAVCSQRVVSHLLLLLW